MTTLNVSQVPLEASTPAQRLRRIAAAVRVGFTWWGVQKTLTVQQKEEVGDTYGADVRLLSAGKKIIDVRHEAYRKLTSLRSRVVSYWRDVTLPYTESGVRLIRQPDIEPFVHSMQGFKEELTQAEADLDRVYEQIKADARRRLGRLYNPDDYPVAVRGLFSVEWDFPSIEPPNYLMQISPEVYQQEQERVTRRFEEAVQLAEQAFISEFARLVAHLTERLSNDPNGQRRVFRDSAVTNISEFFGRFKHLNVSSNEDLDQLVEQSQQMVKGLTPQELRDSDSLRRQVATDLSRVQAQLDGMIIDRPRRRIIRANAGRNGGDNGAGD